jgi:hypothetical protein
MYFNNVLQCPIDLKTKFGTGVLEYLASRMFSWLIFDAYMQVRAVLDWNECQTLIPLSQISPRKRTNINS